MATCSNDSTFLECCSQTAIDPKIYANCPKCAASTDPHTCITSLIPNNGPAQPCRYGGIMPANTVVTCPAERGSWSADEIVSICQESYPGVPSCATQLCACKNTTCTGTVPQTVPTLPACTGNNGGGGGGNNGGGGGRTRCPDGTYVQAGTRCKAAAPGTVGNGFVSCPDGSMVRAGTRCPNPQPSPYPVPSNDPYYPGIQICPNPTGSRFPIVVPANMTCPYFDEAAIATDRAYSWGSPYRRWY